MKECKIVKNRVRELRKEIDIHQDELATKLNVSQQTISRIENGDNSLPADILIDLANFFGVSVDYIVCHSNVRRTEECQIKCNEFSARNYQLCRAYEQLDKDKQDLVYQLVEQLSKI